jgi:hypothetical protein
MIRDEAEALKPNECIIFKWVQDEDVPENWEWHARRHGHGWHNNLVSRKINKGEDIGKHFKKI